MSLSSLSRNRAGGVEFRFSFPLAFVLFWRQGLTIWLWLAWNTTCRLVWLWTHRATLPSASWLLGTSLLSFLKKKITNERVCMTERQTNRWGRRYVGQKATFSSWFSSTAGSGDGAYIIRFIHSKYLSPHWWGPFTTAEPSQLSVCVCFLRQGLKCIPGWSWTHYVAENIKLLIYQHLHP